MNPKCGKRFTPGHYGDKQVICTSPECRKWYKKHYFNTRKRPRGLSRDIFDAILGASEPNPMFHAYIVVAAFSGLRKGEQLGLLWRDVLDGQGGVRTNVQIVRQWSDKKKGFQETKTDDTSVALFLEEARRAIADLVKATGEVDPNARIWPISEMTIWRWFHRAQVGLGITNPDTGTPYRVHDLRHTGAIWVYRATGDLNNAKLFLRHKDISTTQIYAQERPEEVAERLDTAMRGPGGQGKGGLPKGVQTLSPGVENNIRSQHMLIRQAPVGPRKGLK